MSSVFHDIPLDAQLAGLPACNGCGAPGVVWHTDGRIHCPACLVGSMRADSAHGSAHDHPEIATHPRFALLMDLLPRAVSQYIARLQVLDDKSFQTQVCEWTDSAILEADSLFSDVLPAGAGKPGDSARAFNALARSLAALAFVPGGVPFGTTRWEARRGARGGLDDPSSHG